jgi:DNA-binding transcriptional MocR family regulator
VSTSGEIRHAIADGEAKPGERLPPARDLAAVLGVDTTTVLRCGNYAKKKPWSSDVGSASPLPARRNAAPPEGTLREHQRGTRVHPRSLVLARSPLFAGLSRPPLPARALALLFGAEW